jgi:mRNA-degrading endonuclease HigB of HigAB toxin-antitoxin module
MRLIGRHKLQALRNTGAEAEKWLRSWTVEVVNAHWKTASDVTYQFPSVLQEGSIFVFPVVSCRWSIALLVAFPRETALVTALRAKDAHGR